MNVSIKRDFWQTQLDETEICSYINKIREIENVEISRKHFGTHKKLLDNFYTKHAQFFLEHKSQWSIDNGIIKIQLDNAMTEQCGLDLKEILHMLMPWRKGPFHFYAKNFNIYVDAEWRSDKKWDRLCNIYNVKKLCEGKRVLDIGCNNFYYAFRMLEQGADFVLGIDPTPRYFWYYKLFSILFPQEQFFFEMCGAPLHKCVKHCFDSIFCMGILYHQRNPLQCIESLRETLVPNGYLVIDTICIPNKDDVCLFPQKTYQNSRGYWFIPSSSVVKHWVERCGFTVIAKDMPVKTSLDEQRKTAWMKGHSLSDFLHTQDESKTVEGYDAPYRCIVVAQKK